MQIKRILARRYLPLEAFDDAVDFHEALLGETAPRRFSFGDLQVAAVSSILFVGGTEESLAPVRDVHLTFLVDDIHAFAEALPGQGSEIVEAIKPVPTGWNMVVRHPDGTVVEYVEHGVVA